MSTQANANATEATPQTSAGVQGTAPEAGISSAQPQPSAAGITLGRRLAGEAALPSAAGRVTLPFDVLHRHLVILGASGTGKTETSMRIADQVARATAAPIFYLDAKGDRTSAERFAGLMRAVGRPVRIFPNEPFDGWRGDWRAVVNRLLELVEFVPEGPAAYYRDIAKTTLVLACRHPKGPPRSSGELLSRLDYERLLTDHGPSSAIRSLPRDKVSQVRVRFEAFFGLVGGALDGDWSFEDEQAAYFLLDSAALGEDAASVARLLFADFAHYFTLRKQREARCLLFADEFSAIASTTDVASKLEQARAFNAALVLVPQVLSGMGGREQRDRVLGSVDTVIAHASNEPDEIAELAGVRRAAEVNSRVDEGRSQRAHYVRMTERPKVHPDRVRELPTGVAWVIRRGRAAKVAIDRASATEAVALPEARADRPPERVVPEAPKELSYLDEA